jgi:two-component system sensor histidine kinase KdpD
MDDVRIEESPRILVGISSSPSNEKIIRAAAHLAEMTDGVLTALYISAKADSFKSIEDRSRLESNINLAKRLGASVETVFAEDIALQLAEYANESGTDIIVVGNSPSHAGFLMNTSNLVVRLSELAPGLEIYVVPESAFSKYVRPHLMPFSGKKFLIGMLKSVAILTLVSFLGILFQVLGLSDANIITLYILGILGISILTDGYSVIFLSSLMGVLIFNFLFTAPKYTVLTYRNDYPVTFAVMFISAMVTGSLASRLKYNTKKSAEYAYRTKVLLEASRLFQKSESEREILNITAKQLRNLLKQTIVMYAPGENDPEIYVYKNDTSEELLSEKERNIAEDVMKNMHCAGHGTKKFSNALCRYFAIRIGSHVYGVVGIYVTNDIDTFEQEIMLSILGECAIAMDNLHNIRKREEALQRADKERTRANIIRSISHDLRTPLTSISGHASNLYYDSDRFKEAEKKQMAADIYDDSMWLIELVENLLSASKMEDGQINLSMTDELIDDILEEALRHVSRRKSEYDINVIPSGKLLFVHADTHLVIQLIINIINNAMKYSKPGSRITIRSEIQGKDMIRTEISDNGPGISDEAKKHIFEMYYTENRVSSDSSRSMGLGLSICKSIVELHNGTIEVRDNLPHGTTILFTLPGKEIELNEQR